MRDRVAETRVQFGMLLRRWTLGIIAVLCAAGTLACGQGAAPPAAALPQPSDARIRAVADAYLAAYFDRYPETVTVYGVPGHRQDALTDNSLAAQKAWEAREDAWLAEVAGIDRSTIESSPLRATYVALLQLAGLL